MKHITALVPQYLSRSTRPLAAAALLGASCIGTAQAETTDCTPITALPAVITVQGIYCLTENLSTDMATGHAIEIQTNNVTIDLNGWKLGGLAAGTATRTNGIFATNRKNITVRNGTVRGFEYAIQFYGGDAQGNLVEDVRAEQNRLAGIYTEGRGDIIRRNQVVDTGGGTYWPVPSAFGIEASGDGARVLDNDTVGATSAGVGYAVGIYQAFGGGAVIKDNRIAEISDDTGFSAGISLTNSSNGLVSGNRISGPIDYGLYFDSATGGYSDNKVIGATTASFFAGTDYGGNSP